MYSSSRKRCPKTKWALKLLTAAFLAASPAAKSAVNNAYDALIIEARKGNTQPALLWFAQKSALSNNQIADWLQIALWAGQDKQVITVYNRYRHQQLPARGYAAVAVAYRNLQQWQNSLTLWQKALSLESQNKDYQRGQILTLADAGHYDSALVKLKQLNSGAPDKANLLAEAYIYKLAGRHEDELRAMTGSLPENALTQQYPTEYVQALRNNQLAAAIDDANLTPDIRADIHAELVRLSFMPTRSESERYAIADRALAQYAALEILWHDNSDRTAQYQRIQVDHLGALLTRDRYKDVISHYQRLKIRGKLFRPGRNIGLRRLISKNSSQKSTVNNDRALYHKETIAPDLSDEELADLFYSHLESENYPGALTVTQHTINTSPPFLRLMGTPTSIPNDTWLQGHSFLSTVAKYSNDLPQTEMIARELAYNAPGNQGLRIDYASVLQARGWHRAAENELKKQK